MSAHQLLVSSLLCVCLAVLGCKSAPPGVQSETEAAPKMGASELDRKVAEAANGLNRVERNGVVYYCKRYRQIGSNLSTLKCMTESQLRVEVETMAQVRDEMRNRMGRCTAGRSGRGGPCGGT